MENKMVFFLTLLASGAGLAIIVWLTQVAADHHDELIRQQTIQEVCR